MVAQKTWRYGLLQPLRLAWRKASLGKGGTHSFRSVAVALRAVALGG